MEFFCFCFIQLLKTVVLAWEILAKKVLFLGSNGGIDTFGITVHRGVAWSSVFLYLSFTVKHSFHLELFFLTTFLQPLKINSNVLMPLSNRPKIKMDFLAINL